MDQYEVNANLKAQQQCKGDASCANQAQTGVPVQGLAGGFYQRPSTLQEEAEKNAAYHYEMANKSAQAAAFLSSNPAFDEFVRLVRAGVIQF